MNIFTRFCLLFKKSKYLIDWSEAKSATVWVRYKVSGGCYYILEEGRVNSKDWQVKYHHAV